METLVTIMLVFLVVWGLFTGYVFVDTWRQVRAIAKSAEQTLVQARVQAASLQEIRAEARRLVVLARADYARERGMEEPSLDEVRTAFSGF